VKYFALLTTAARVQEMLFFNKFIDILEWNKNLPKYRGTNICLPVNHIAKICTS
jgi:hypothetical protein